MHNGLLSESSFVFNFALRIKLLVTRDNRNDMDGFEAPRPLFSIWPAQRVQAFLLKPPLVSATPTSLPLLFSSPLRLSICSWYPFLSFVLYLTLSGTPSRKYLSLFLSGL